MLFVVLLHLGFRHDHVAHDFLADDPLREHLVLHLRLEILVRQAGILTDERLEFVGVGNLLLHLNLSQAARDLGVHADIEVLALLHEQQGIDFIAQRVGGVFVHRLLQAGPVKTLALRLRLDLEALLVKLATSDDIAVDFGGDLFDDFDVVVCRGANRGGVGDEYYKTTKHN
jgi:hypothetical protein